MTTSELINHLSDTEIRIKELQSLSGKEINESVKLKYDESVRLAKSDFNCTLARIMPYSL